MGGNKKRKEREMRFCEIRRDIVKVAHSSEQKALFKNTTCLQNAPAERGLKQLATTCQSENI